MQIYETAIKDLSKVNGLKYKIQLRSVDGVWQQRHIWYPAPATYVPVGTVQVDPWMRSTQTGNPGGSFKPVKGAGDERVPPLKFREMGA